MATRQELEQQRSRLEQERRRLREIADLNGTLAQEIIQLRNRERQLVAQATELQTQGQSNIQLTDDISRTRSLLQVRELQIQQARVRLAEISEEIQATDAELLKTDFGVRETASRDQGANTVSAGSTVAQDQQANAAGADTQNPAPPSQTVTDTGEVTSAPSTATPSNATPTQTDTPTATEAPPVLPPGQVSATPGATATVPIATGSQSPAAARQSGLVNLQSADQDDTLVSYVYQATRVVSNFRQGRFTQDIEGAQIFFQLPQKPQPPAQPVVTGTRSGGNNAPAQPQGTVQQTVATPGTSNLGVNFVGSEFGAFFGTGETGEQSQQVNGALPGTVPGGARPPRSPPAQRSLPGSTFEAEGFGDPTAEQGTAQAPLQARPPTSGSTPATAVNIAPARTTALATGSGNASRESLQQQLASARRELAENERLLTGVQQRIDRREGDPITNRELRALYTANIQREQRLIARLEAELNNPVGAGPSSTNVAPQQGAKEY
jgi:hypothetical protein